MPARQGEVQKQALKMEVPADTIYSIPATTPDSDPMVGQISEMCGERSRNFTVPPP